MSKPVDRMRSLMVSLPERDIPLGYKFLDARDFEQLKELVDSALYKVKKNQKSENPKEEYLKVNIEDLSILKSEIDSYIIPLNGVCNDFYEEFNVEIEDEIDC